MKASLTTAVLAVLCASSSLSLADDSDAYSRGFWDGYASAHAQLATDRRGWNPYVAVTTEDGGAPVWVAAPLGSGGISLPAYFVGSTAGDAAAATGVRGLYFSGPFVWQGNVMPAPDKSDAGRIVIDPVALRMMEADKAEPDPATGERIRQIRRMGINEGFVVLRVAPSN
jgi:hypothetical protein